MVRELFSPECVSGRFIRMTGGCSSDYSEEQERIIVVNGLKWQQIKCQSIPPTQLYHHPLQ